MIFLLGAAGFVGSAFARLFASEGVDFRAIEVGSYGAHAGEDCSILIHAAGSSRKYLADEDPAADFQQSVSLVMRAMSDYRPELFVLVSSVDVYNHLDDPDRNREDAPIDPIPLSAYGFHKLLAELCVQRHAQRWIIARLAGMVGPGLRKNPVHDVLHGEPLRIHPDSRYQFMPTDDVARVVWKLARTAPPAQIYNVCGRGLISPREIAAIAGRSIDTSRLPADSRPRIVQVNTEKVGALAELPETVTTIREYVARAAAGV